MSGSGAAPVECGYWGCVDSTVDWCESNYVVLSFVAEFLNTTSSLLITVSAMVGWYLSRRHHETANSIEFTLAYMGVGLVGLGSACFHATLRQYPQYLDEVPMLISSSAFIYIMLKGDPQVSDGSRDFNRWLGGTIAVFCGAAIISYVLMNVFVLFFVAFFIAVSFLVLFPLFSTSCFKKGDTGLPCNTHAAKKHFYTAAACYNLGFVMWVWEHFRCLQKTDNGFEPNPHRGWETKIVPFHALWHFFAGLGSTYYVGFLVCLTAYRQGRVSETVPVACCCFHPSDVPDPSTFTQVEMYSTDSMDFEDVEAV
eukprot:TRINITY_DN3615_c0_g1_i1.p1 TRINITY_DN3615_c0_g1~~TRINITY_DN3615_c0_g1_i1.p1  ORF type:complete len:323 (+),score=70.53 TRINITY_DN3615_c0_g1_i1:39-971(+)